MGRRIRIGVIWKWGKLRILSLKISTPKIMFVFFFCIEIRIFEWQKKTVGIQILSTLVESIEIFFNKILRIEWFFFFLNEP